MKTTLDGLRLDFGFEDGHSAVGRENYLRVERDEGGISVSVGCTAYPIATWRKEGKECLAGLLFEIDGLPAAYDGLSDEDKETVDDCVVVLNKALDVVEQVFATDFNAPGIKAKPKPKKIARK